jgi:hypothetical protein
MKRVFFLVLLLLSAAISHSQEVHVDSLCMQAYNRIMSMQFGAARPLLIQEKLLHPDNVYVDYLENYMDFLKVFIGEDQPLFRQLEDTFALRYTRINQLPDSSRYKNLMLANMNLQWAFARLKFGEYFSAAWELNRAYRMLTENAERFPHFVPNFISLGVMHVMIGLVPDQYRWMLKIISMHGSVEQGKKEIYRALDQAAADPSYAYLFPEALFYLGFIELNLSSGPQAMQRLMSYLRKTDNDNLLMDFLKADIYMRYGQNEKALKQLQNTPREKGYYPFYYLQYMEGECYLRKQQPDSADRHFQTFLENFKGSNYIKDAWRKRAWAALLQNNPVLYRQYLDSVKVHGGTKTGADNEARKEAENRRLPNSNLIRARLLFDGGYYRKAKTVLDTMNTENLSEEEQIERTYRFARIAHRQKRIPEAKNEYRKTLETGKRSPRYFAANAALKLGEIYESEDSLSQAKNYYQKCLQLKFDEYVSSIRAKAKEALQRLREKQQITSGN